MDELKVKTNLKFPHSRSRRRKVPQQLETCYNLVRLPIVSILCVPVVVVLLLFISIDDATCAEDGDASSLLSPPLPLPTDKSGEVDPCEACKLVVSSFEKGVESTARGKHEGGDTSWEEKNLKSYADSEVRLVEIQEALCEDVTKGKAQCLSLAEDNDHEIEEWWFKHRSKNVRLHDYLCISKLKRCCPGGKFGPTCQACPSACNNHGGCEGEGTRSGSGKCVCEPGFVGEQCENCATDHYRVDIQIDKFACRPCNSACMLCYGPGPTNCTECRTGYHKHETMGCIDINECDVGLDSDGNTKVCTGNTYCVNTNGGHKCTDCHVSCNGCVGYGNHRCLSCARGYQMDDKYNCRTHDEIERMREESNSYDDEDSVDDKKARVYFFYASILVTPLILFRSSFSVVITYALGLTIVLLVCNPNLLEDLELYNPRPSPD